MIGDKRDERGETQEGREGGEGRRELDNKLLPLLAIEVAEPIVVLHNTHTHTHTHTHTYPARISTRNAVSAKT